eukprot:Cvel_15379.t1-p1 / transcript=Cvel_15379.t1 / gene=Cvel_15379 / organism=Chromera_velia_CCMP2878 / gene_product=hypothetical protein / transcript_product=hypothetical protein / location=Cvel_scaffold1135:1-2205(-) / protein_length=404 / sequence_SO=supercontig / SO=protein_coding / is_pseudo=false
MAETLRKALAASFRTIDGMETETLQSHEVLALLADDKLPGMLVVCIQEAAELSGDPGLSHALSEAKGDGSASLQIPKICEALRLPKPSAPHLKSLPLQERQNILRNVLAELFMARLSAQEQTTTDLKVPVSSITERDRELLETLQGIQKALHLQADTINGAAASSLSTEIAGKAHAVVTMSLAPAVSAQKQKLISLPKTHLLLPSLSITPALYRLLESMNSEYRNRLEVLLRRLDVTVEAFMWSHKLQQSSSQSNKGQGQSGGDSLAAEAIAALSKWKDDIRARFAGGEGERKGGPSHAAGPRGGFAVHDLLGATRDLLSWEPISSTKRAVSSSLKAVTIGQVANRGGVPEGYTAVDIERDVGKANFQLKQKDVQEKRNVQEAKKWIGEGKGAPPPPQRGGRGG